MIDSSDLEPQGPRTRARPTGVTVLSVLAVFYTLYFAREFLLPIVFAILLSFLLTPVVRALTKLKIPQSLAAAIVVLGLIGVGALGGYQLSGPVQTWVADAPASIAVAQRELGKLMKPFEKMTKSAEQVEGATGGVGSKPPVVVVQGPSLISRVFGTTQRFAAGLFEVLILLFFMLSAGDLFLRKSIKVLPHLRDKLKAIRIARQVENSISTYLLTTLAVNLMEGAAVALAMRIIGMPTPILWGALVAAFEFIPYLGAFSMVVILTMAGFTAFGSLGHALVAPGAFLLINLLQTNIVTPLVLSHRLALNPVAVFIGLAFWFWIWGIPGAFIGVPLLAVTKICCDQVAGLAPIGEFLGHREESTMP